jgi:hypothetical protein
MTIEGGARDLVRPELSTDGDGIRHVPVTGYEKDAVTGTATTPNGRTVTLLAAGSDVYVFPAGDDRIVAYWFAYIVTRPLGASFADWMGVPADRSGLGWGTGPVTIGWAVLIAAFVGYLTVTGGDVEPDDAPA